ncbi:MAG: flagellar export chaperone FliS [Spirochaetaceae bacterium]|nr:flagellar export chaperone FliS [Spirochaetaceae bacterium]
MGYNQPYNAYSAYRETGVRTASQGKLVVMLYDEAVKQLNFALSYISENNKIEAPNIEQFSKHILKVQEIITELMVALDMEAGGDIAKNLMSLYIYFNQELLSISINHSRSKTIFIHDMMSQLRDAWAEAATEAGNEPAPIASGINING